MKSFKQHLTENRNYMRVIPRDLFNEGNLLKCYGNLYIQTESYSHIELDYDNRPFNIVQNPDDGSLSISNVKLLVHDQEIELYRPLNSREPYPLWFMDYDDENDPYKEVFTNSGKLSPAFIQKFITR